MSDVEMILPERPVFTPNADMYGMTIDIPRKDSLKPCPFCGSKAELLTMSYSGGKVYGVFCISDLEAEYQHGHFIDNYRTQEEAIDAWNRRRGNV